MIKNLDDENIVLEIKELVNKIESAKEDFNIYCELMTQIFLSSSGKN